MLCVLFFVLLISGTLTLDEEDLLAERSNYTCVVPPSDIIRNGRFRVEGYNDDEQPRAGKKLYSYVLLVTCNPGFNRKSGFLVSCYKDTGPPEFPLCIPTCKQSSPDVFSCGSSSDNQEAQCIVPSDLVNQISTRARTELQCGEVPHVIRTAVVNGRLANREEVPWHAGVYTKTTSPYMQICGGTIVSNNVIISAAHCFWSDVDKLLPAENYAVAVGKLFRPWNATKDSASAQKFDVQEIRIPPRFQGSATNFQDDIALLLLGAPYVIEFSSYITPACLDFNFDFDAKQLSHGKLGRVGGWGLDSEDGPASQVLNVVEMPVVGIEQCITEAEPGFLSSITSDKICAGYTNGTAVCKGDSGGGLLVPDVEFEEGTRRYFLRGIVSTAPRSDRLCNIYAVATFTHVVKHEHFIMAAISQTPLINEPPNLSPTPTTYPPIIVETEKSADKVVTEDKRNTDEITEKATDTSLIGSDTNDEETTTHSANTNAFEDNTFDENTTQTILSPLPLTNLNSSHSKEKLNTTTTVRNRDEDFQEIDADLSRNQNTQDNETEKIDLEPITNPPSNDDVSYEKEDNKDIEEEDDKNLELSFETVNFNQNPVTDTIKESSENTEDESSVHINDNIKKSPTLRVPIGISIGQTYESADSKQNIDSSPTDEGLSTETGASNVNTNDQQANIPSSGEAIEVNLGQISKFPSINIPIGINVGAVNTIQNPVTVKNDDTITIWPTLTPEDNIDPVASNPGTENNVEYTQTTAILEDHWVTAGPDCDHDTPGHYHHHGPYHHGWQNQPNGQSPHQNWHKQPNGPSFHHNWHMQPSWQNYHDWNPTNWQHKRYHPFVEYHHGFTQPSKPTYAGPWFGRPSPYFRT